MYHQQSSSAVRRFCKGFSLNCHPCSLRPWRVLAAQAGPRERFFPIPTLFTRERVSCSPSPSREKVGEARMRGYSRFLRPWREKVGEARMRGYHVGQAVPDNAPKGHLSLFTRPSSSRSVLMRDIGASHGIIPGHAGFTLIEILVVVLIIGILGAIMLPQYQRAVLKSRFAGLMPIAKAMADSNEAYYLEHGEYAGNAEDLPVQGRNSYPDGTNVYLYPGEEDVSFVQVGGSNIPNARYVVYQKHSANFPDTTWCEAGDERAEEMCVAFGGQEQTGLTGNSSLGDDAWKAYLLTGMVRNGDSFIICPKDTTCDANGNITECASGLTLNNGECVTCDIPNATSCSTTSYAPTACSDGYIVNGTACEPDPAYAQLQALAASKCPANQTTYVCTIKNGAVSQCDTNSGTINEQGECVSNGTPYSIYEIVYNPDGTEKQTYRCRYATSGHCYDEEIKDYSAGTGKMRRCANNTTISKGATCADGYANFGADYTFDSHRNSVDTGDCSAVNTQGVCTAYSSMFHNDITYDGNTETGRVYSQCASISGTTCNNYANLSAFKDHGTFKTSINCYNSNSGSSSNIRPDGTCSSGSSIQQSTKTNVGVTYKECSSYASIDWKEATCS